jgi:hypothetical protein
MLKEKITSAWQKTKVWINKHLVKEAHEWWMLWSIRLNALGIAILAWVQFDPVSVLAVWNMMPAPMRQALPPNIFYIVAIILFILGMIARLVRQPKVEQRHKND